LEKGQEEYRPVLDARLCGHDKIRVVIRKENQFDFLPTVTQPLQRVALFCERMK